MIWKSSLIIPIPKHSKDTSIGTLYLASLLSRESTRVSDSATINKYLQPAPDHSTTSALLQMTTDIAMGFNQRKHPDRTICVAADLWLSCYVKGRHAKTFFRGVKSTSRIVSTGKAVGRSIINYAAPVWCTNLQDTNYRNIQYTQNEALRIATGCNKMSRVDHLHIEAEMLMVREHSELLSAQYLARCLEPENVCHSITTREIPKRQMMETLFTRLRSTVERKMLADNRKATLQTIHTYAVNKAVKYQKK